MLSKEEGKQSPSPSNKLSPQLRALVWEALATLGYEADAGIEEIVELVRQNPKLKTELQEMLLESFQAAVAKVQLSPNQQQLSL